MKLQIDTTGKTIRIEESVKLTDLFSAIKKLLPNDEWESYSLEQSIISNWWNPTYINSSPTFIPLQTVPFYTTCKASFGAMSEMADQAHVVYNLEVN